MNDRDITDLFGVSLAVAVGIERSFCEGALSLHHYLHTVPDPRGMPLYYSVRLNGEWIGTVVYGRPESNRCYKGGLSYGSIADRAAGKARFDRWEVLNLARVWLSPAVQAGGRLCDPDTVPGFVDRRGIFRSTLASAVVRLSIARVRFDYLMLYPPCFLQEPYQIRAVLSYCDRKIHRGTLYRASGFRLARTNQDRVETWFEDVVPALEPDQDDAVRAAARYTDRSIRKRHARGRIDLQRVFEF